MCRHASALDLPADTASAQAARRFAEQFVARRHVRVDIDALDLLVSELVANAVVHARSGVRLRLSNAADGLLVEVTDAEPALERLLPASPSLSAESGRGLYLVEHLAHCWGVESSCAGKTVWFMLDCA